MEKARNTLKLKPDYVDCSTAMMLDTLDQGCQMSQSERAEIEQIYNQVKGQRGNVLGHQQHDLIILGCAARCKDAMCAEMTNLINEQRQYCAEMISDSAMEAFKAIMRNKGFFPIKEEKHVN